MNWQKNKIHHNTTVIYLFIVIIDIDYYINEQYNFKKFKTKTKIDFYMPRWLEICTYYSAIRPQNTFYSTNFHGNNLRPPLLHWQPVKKRGGPFGVGAVHSFAECLVIFFMFSLWNIVSSWERSVPDRS